MSDQGIEVEGQDPEVLKEIAKDGGYGSRKFWLTIVSMAIIVILTLVGSLSAFTSIGANLPTAVGGILGALGIFAGANVATKWSAAQASKPAVKPVVKPAAKPPVEHG
jgi:hypothetical protein